MDLHERPPKPFFRGGTDISEAPGLALEVVFVGGETGLESDARITLSFESSQLRSIDVK